jgi:Male sterility protein/haloacid dehalogenase-like hydrolase
LRIADSQNGQQSSPVANRSGEQTGAPPGANENMRDWPIFWRVEGSLAQLTAVRPIAYFTWNAHTFAERWARRGGLFLQALIRPALYAGHRVVATRILHALLRGVSRDRLDLLGEEYFEYVLKRQLRAEGLAQLRECMAQNGQVILVSQGLDHVMRPLAQYLGIERIVANRLEFRNGIATGRLLNPVIRPRGPFALFGNQANGRVSGEQLLRDLGLKHHPDQLREAVFRAQRPTPQNHSPLVAFDRQPGRPLSVRQTLRGKQVLLVGVTGFIGKVWFEHVLSEIPEIGKIYLLVRRQRNSTARRRFEKIVEVSPVFDRLEKRYGKSFAAFLSEKIEVVEGDVSAPRLGFDDQTHDRLARTIDLVVNSSGLTDFNPDLREALASNVEPAACLIEFLRASDHAALLHLSTCYVVGGRDGRVSEDLKPNYTPVEIEDFDYDRELRSLYEMVRKVEERAHSPEVEAALRRQALGRLHEHQRPPGREVEESIRKNRLRWIRNRLIRAGTRRARRLGWPNTYTFTKSLAESLLAMQGAGLPIAVVRPSIVETSIEEPFRGWNEGINTSAPLSYLLGTYFRQLPSNERKRLDVIPVDMACRGMTLIAAALLERRHERLYQLATSANNPCDMGRSIELTALAHRKHYRAQQGLEHWVRMRFDTIPVSKERYRNLSVPAQKFVVRGINRAASALQFKRPPLAKAERDLERVEKLIELYEPFILHNEQVFECDNVQLLSALLPADERRQFAYEPGEIDWWDYWINIHIPALRKWCYPLIEGHAIEAVPRREFRLPDRADGSSQMDASGA